MEEKMYRSLPLGTRLIYFSAGLSEPRRAKIVILVSSQDNLPANSPYCFVSGKLDMKAPYFDAGATLVDYKYLYPYTALVWRQLRQGVTTTDKAVQAIIRLGLGIEKEKEAEGKGDQAKQVVSHKIDVSKLRPRYDLFFVGAIEKEGTD